MSKTDITQIIVGEEESVQIKDYQFIKPHVSITVKVNPDDDVNEKLAQTQQVVHSILQRRCGEIRKFYNVIKK